VYKLILKTYVDLDGNYLRYPEEMLSVHSLIEELDNYIDERLKIYQLNEVQKEQIKVAKQDFIEG
jgi:hypothetical protein